MELTGKTLGVFGFGNLGRRVAELGHAFRMNVIACAHRPTEKPGYEPFEFVSQEELFRRSDIISLHCPLTEETYHMIDAESITQMKEGVILVNTSRGALIDAEALLEGIKSRRVGAACLDVYEEESEFFFEDLSGHIVEDDVLARLISMPNVLLTSHQAFLTEEALENIAETTVGNLTELARCGTCKNELTQGEAFAAR
jgi:D-lactate dehydrogenase